MSRLTLTEAVSQTLRSLNGDLGDAIAGFWIRPDPYLDRDEAVVLMLVDFVDDEVADEEASRTESVAESVDVCDRVAEALEPMIASSCWFTTNEDFESNGPPLDPESFQRLNATPSAV